MSTSVASRYSHDSAPCETVDSRKWRPVRRFPTSLPSMSTSASTTVSTVRSATARSRASTVSDAPASSPFGAAADSLRAWTSVMPYLQYQLASHPTPLQTFVRCCRTFQWKHLVDDDLEIARINQLRDLLQRVAIGLAQRLHHTHAALFRRGLQLVRGIAGHLEQATAPSKRVKQRVDVVASDQVEHNIDLTRLQRRAIRAPGSRDHSSAVGLRDLYRKVADAAPRSMDQRCLAIPNLRRLDKALPGCEPGKRKCSGLDV